MTEIDGIHVMLDIETLGTDPGNDVILSMAAVKFDSEAIYEGDTFYEEISTKSCNEYDMGNEDEDTKDWWENNEATYTRDGRPLPEVLRKFSKWTPNGSYYLWSKGPSFDCAFIQKAYNKCESVDKKPWKFWNERDVRTREYTFELNHNGSSPEPDSLEGTDHDPVYDVKKQALGVQISYHN